MGARMVEMTDLKKLRVALDAADVILCQHYDVGWHNGLTEGERKATAAIVAYLRKMRGDPAYYRVCMEVDNLRNHIEAGHHLRDAAKGA